LDQRNQVIEFHHALGHYGAKMIQDKIRNEGYYWPKMLMDIRKVVQQCQPCMRYNIEQQGYHPAKSITAQNPWDHVQIDLIGPLPISENGHVYIMTVVDVCTGYTIIRSVKNKEMETIAKCLWCIFCEYGTPQILQSDNGSEFVNQVMKTLSVMYGIDHRLTTAYHPSANGLVERMNKEVSKALKKYTEGTYAAWDEWMPLVQIGLNESINRRTGSTPFSLMFGRKFNGFKDFDGIEGSPNLESSKIVESAWKQFKDVVLPSLEKRVANVKDKQEKKLNTRRQVAVLEPGTMVMALDQTRSSKWDPIYEGPFEVVKQHKGGAYSLKDSLG
jgi:transposase InsO family protein